jgi:hypothetical protein
LRCSYKSLVNFRWTLRMFCQIRLRYFLSGIRQLVTIPIK